MIDKALINWEGYGLTSSWDFETVDDDLATLQAVQNRCLAVKESRTYDDNFGGLLFQELKDESSWIVQEAQVKSLVQEAIKPMIEENRVQELQNVTITDRTGDTLQVEIKVLLNTTVGIITYNITL